MTIRNAIVKVFSFSARSLIRRQAISRRPRLEVLEDRTLPSVNVVSLAYPASAATTANGQSEVGPMSSVSDDGRFVVYSSLATNLVQGQTESSPVENLFLYDNSTQTTTLISHAAGSATMSANGASFNGVISGDGSTVAFYSTATNLISGVTIPSGAVELYVYNVSTGALTLASSEFGNSLEGSNGENPAIPPSPSSHWANTLAYSAGSAALGEDIYGLALPSLSGNGQYIAYIDDATNLGAANTGLDAYSGLANTNVFLYDNNSADAGFGTNILVSHAAGQPTTTASGSTSGGGAYATTAAISADGSTIAFTDPGTNLVSGESGGGIGVSDELYVWSRTGANGLIAGQTVLASHAAGGNLTGATIPNSLSSFFGYSQESPPSLNANGNEVVYYYAGNNRDCSKESGFRLTLSC